jgi:NADPH:quinone reductase-like Zn-dependent oxidoreductase
MMKAYVYDKSSSDGRSWNENVAKPTQMKSYELIVKVVAAGINPVDYKLPHFMVKNRAVGLDFSGIVTEIGSDVKDFAVGDKVFGNTAGTMCEYTVCNSKKIAKVPEGLSMVEAAAMPTTYLTSYQALKGHGFKEGMSVLVIGASGGCGTSGVQIAKALGASEIVGVCSKKNEEFVKELGADSIVDYNSQTIVDVCGTNHFDQVYDTASSSGGGEAYYKQSMQVLKKKTGVYTYLNGGLLSFIRKLTIGTPKSRDLILTEHSKTDLESIIGLMTAQGEKFAFRPNIHQALPFDKENIEAGFAELKSRRAKGKIVFKIVDEE